MSYVDIGYKWYNEIHNTEAYYAYFMPMMLICFKVKKNGNIPGMFKYESRWEDLLMYNLKNPLIELDSYTMDIHTMEGNKKGYTKKNYKGVKHFLDEGAYIDHRYIPSRKIAELRSYYMFTKILSVSGFDFEKAKEYLPKKKSVVFGEDKIKIFEKGSSEGSINMEELFGTDSDSDSDEDKEDKEDEDKEDGEEGGDENYTEEEYFKFIARPQIPTGKNKFDTYFAEMKESYGSFEKGEIVFVKGPFGDKKVYDVLKFLRDIKDMLGINYVDIKFIKLLPSDVSFMGDTYVKELQNRYIRYSIDKTKHYYYIIFKNLCGDISTRKYGSIKTEKSEPWKRSNATVVDWDKTTNCKRFKFVSKNGGDLRNKKYLKYYTLSIFFRMLFGITDHADRNFIIDLKNDKFYGVDEENVTLDKESKFEKYSNQLNYIVKNWDKKDIKKELKRWSKLLHSKRGKKLLKKYDKKLFAGDGKLKGTVFRRMKKVIKKPKKLLISKGIKKI